MRTIERAIDPSGAILISKSDLEKAIIRLPEDQKVVLTLRFSKQLSIAEISKLLNCSITTTYSRLNRALITLRHEFNPSAFNKIYSILYPETGRPGKVE